MSFVSDQIRRIDAQLDRITLSRPSGSADSSLSAVYDLEITHVDGARIEHLQALIKTLSPSPANRSALVPLTTIRSVLKRSKASGTRVSTADDSVDAPPEDGLAHELEWLMIAKATNQIYGQLINSILDHTIPLSHEIEYWSDIIESYQYTALYSLQTAPLRLWDIGKDIYREVSQKQSVQGASEGARQGWRQFYGLVKEVVRKRSLADIRTRVMSPLTRVRSECRGKRNRLKSVRLMNANALGLLLGEGLSNQTQHEKEAPSPSTEEDEDVEADTWKDTRLKWRTDVVKSIALMDAVVQCYTSDSIGVDTYDDAVGAATEEDEFYRLAASTGTSPGENKLKTIDVTERLENLLSTRLPAYQTTFKQQVDWYGRPSMAIRYWVPATAFILSSSTIFRILVNRKAEILTWIQEFGATVRDFWMNWVVEPTRKVIGTIRHDEGSEVSIMSKRSLEGDRDSLERMVVDFAVQSNEGGGRNLTEAQIQDIRVKVKEGDLTTVLKAYEKDMQSPFMGVLRGNLVRALLIQVQKTKVDVEVAMGGVDSILKSQELLFGFIGLTPGLLVSIGAFRWLRSTFGGRSTARSSKQAGQLLRQLRNIDRILVSATPTDFGELSYKDQGLLLCEAHLLRQDSGKVMPKQTYRDFLDDVDELLDIRIGIDRQRKVVQRLRWAYSRWLQ